MIPDFGATIAGLATALRELGHANPAAAVIALLIIALALALLLLGRAKHAFEDVREEDRKSKFQEQILDELRTLRTEAAAAREREAGMAAQIDLMREQLRRAIDLLVDVRDGRVAPAAIVIPEARP